MSSGLFSTSIFKPRFKRNGSNPAKLVVLGARIITCDTNNPRAEALAVKDERIVYVGDNRGANDYIGPDTEVINARKRMLTPGFVDNHCHVLWVGALQAISSINLFECKSLDEVKSMIIEHAEDKPELPFLNGGMWKYDYMPGGIPDAKLLDSIVKDRPAILGSYGGLAGWLNTMAVELLQGRNPEAFNLLKPSIDQDTGEYTGMLHHFHSFSPLDFFSWEELGPTIQDEMMDAMKEILDEAVSVGVTTMNDCQIYRPFMPVILKLRERGGLDNVRVRCSLYINYNALEDEKGLRADLGWWKELGEKESDPQLILGDSLKLYIDGNPGNLTSFMLEPYCGTTSNYGRPEWTQEGFNRVMEIVDSMELQACTHSIGDAGIHRVVNAYDHAQEVNGKRDSRHRVDHCELPTPEDQERMARLEIHAAMQPTHFFGDETNEKLLEKQRLVRFMPWRSLEKAGVTLSFGSDWCAGPINPIYGLIISSTRLNYKGETDWGSDQKIELEDAIRHWTIDSAKALKMEDDIGSIEVGKYGDFVLFNTNLLKLDSWWFLITNKIELGALDDFVDMTVVGGKAVYRK